MGYVGHNITSAMLQQAQHWCCRSKNDGQDNQIKLYRCLDYFGSAVDYCSQLTEQWSVSCEPAHHQIKYFVHNRRRFNALEAIVLSCIRTSIIERWGTLYVPPHGLCDNHVSVSSTKTGTFSSTHALPASQLPLLYRRWLSHSIKGRQESVSRRQTLIFKQTNKVPAISTCRCHMPQTPRPKSLRATRGTVADVQNWFVTCQCLGVKKSNWHIITPLSRNESKCLHIMSTVQNDMKNVKDSISDLH